MLAGNNSKEYMRSILKRKQSMVHDNAGKYHIDEEKEDAYQNIIETLCAVYLLKKYVNARPDSDASHPNMQRIITTEFSSSVRPR